MVKILGPEDATGDARNAQVFSAEIADCIRRCIQAGALHPATMVGVLNYHATAVSTTFQHCFMPPAAPGIVAPPPGFNPKGA